MLSLERYPSINHYPDMIVDKALSTPNARVLVVGVRAATALASEGA